LIEKAEENEKSRASSGGSFEFRTANAATIFDYLTNAFMQDYMTKSLARSDSGWRSLGDVAKDLHMSTSVVYAKKRNQLSPPVGELVERGFVEKRFFHRERGRGGEVMRFRLACENEVVKEFVENRIRGNSNQMLHSSKPRIETIDSDKLVKAKERKLDKLRIAVLPFANISPDPKDEYFADGLTDELISTFSKISQLKVISRTSVMRYKQTVKSLSEIASELNLNAALEGSVRKMGDELRITAQLIDVQNDEQLWSDDYDRKFENVFSLQKEIALKVADSLKVSILDKEMGEMGKRPTLNLDAYVLYVKGRSFKHIQSLDSFTKTIEYCKLAIDMDPNYAQAYAELALNYALMGYYELLPSNEVFPRATELAQKAIQLDNTIAESHVALGLTLYMHMWKFKEAEKEYRLALDLNPNLVDAHLFLSFALSEAKRFNEARPEIKRALELDPLSEWTCSFAAAMYFADGQYANAIELFKDVLELVPNSALAHDMLGCIYVEKGMYKEAISEIRKSRELGRGIDSLSDLAHAYAKMGMIDEVRNILDDLLRRSERGERVEVAVASTHLNLGDFDDALEWLEKAYKSRNGRILSVNSDHSFDDIRGDPRFQAFLKKIGF